MEAAGPLAFLSQSMVKISQIQLKFSLLNGNGTALIIVDVRIGNAVKSAESVVYYSYGPDC